MAGAAERSSEGPQGHQHALCKAKPPIGRATEGLREEEHEKHLCAINAATVVSFHSAPNKPDRLHDGEARHQSMCAHDNDQKSGKGP